MVEQERVGQQTNALLFLSIYKSQSIKLCPNVMTVECIELEKRQLEVPVIFSMDLNKVLSLLVVVILLAL